MPLDDRMFDFTTAYYHLCFGISHTVGRTVSAAPFYPQHKPYMTPFVHQGTGGGMYISMGKQNTLPDTIKAAKYWYAARWC